MDAPANTVSYFIAGYAVIFGVMLIYLASLIVRGRNLQRDLETLEEIQQQDAQAAAHDQAGVSTPARS